MIRGKVTSALVIMMQRSPRMRVPSVVRMPLTVSSSPVSIVQHNWMNGRSVPTTRRPRSAEVTDQSRVYATIWHLII